MAQAAGVPAYTVRDRCMVGGIKERRVGCERPAPSSHRVSNTHSMDIRDLGQLGRP
jgi:hypothetical protein